MIQNYMILSSGLQEAKIGDGYASMTTSLRRIERIASHTKFVYPSALALYDLKQKKANISKT